MSIGQWKTAVFRFRKNRTQKKEYDRENLRPVLRCSICTGEQVAGFRDIRTGVFHEIMLIRSQDDLDEFMETYALRSVSREY